MFKSSFILEEDIHYPTIIPYSPSEYYPESPFNDISPEKNSIYSYIRALLFDLELDLNNFTYNKIIQKS